MIRLLVDGIFFQIAQSGIARVWMSLLPLMARSGRFEIFMLDRGRVPALEAIHYIPCPKNLFMHMAEDSVLIQRICDHYKIDAFTSTYYTTPLDTPMVLMVYDMIPELFDFDLSARGWMEKDTAISFAQRYVCISENTRRDLLDLYPEIPADKVAAVHCGVDDGVFYPRSKYSVNSFRQRFSLDRPYFLFVGSRVQHNRYKNSRLFFEAISAMKQADFDIFCVGGEKEIEPEILGMIPPGSRCSRVELTDDELAEAYGGASALIYPSLYEGFGMPVIEAMASGCPVITTPNGSLAEAAGDAACFVSGTSVEEMRTALTLMKSESYREELKLKGLQHARNFKWQDMADVLSDQVEAVVEEFRAGVHDSFFRQWRRLREVQASVDA
jgi:glycosyltransferase involved in cell wall biosynthesis